MTQASIQAPPTPEPMSAALAVFSAELAKRLPDRFVKRFVFPSNIRNAREVFVREIDGKDEIAAAAMADSTMSKQERDSVKMAYDAERRENVRLAIVGLGVTPERGGPIVYRHVNADGIPFTEINTWATSTWGCLYAYFGQLNGVPQAELASGIAEAQTVGAFASPTNGTPPSDDTAK